MAADPLITKSTEAAQSAARRVLVLAPAEGDCTAIVHVLDDAGYLAHPCANVGEMAAELRRDDYAGAGVFVIAQEALFPANHEHGRLAQTLAQQPEWSDLPVVLLGAGGVHREEAWEIARRLDPVGNITILERPLKRTTLVNAVAVALRARQRQYELRVMLAELSDHRERLQGLVERKTLELAASTAGLAAAERLASLGTLAAGLGHDIANLVMPIRMRLDALRSVCGIDESRQDIEAIEQSLSHLSQLSAGMRLMAIDPERATSSPPAMDLQAWAAEATPMLQAALPRHVRLQVEVAPGIGLRIARHQLVQAVFNLVQNAGDAMAARPSGLVRIVAEPSWQHAGMVSLRVIDDGPGMPPEVLARCFEPYFSTKRRAISTGMGLAMIKGIVDAAQGSVAVESALGAGTTFTILLPGSDAEPSQGGVHARKLATLSLRNTRIAALASMILEQLGVGCERAGEPVTPASDLWVLDHAEPERTSAYLASDPARRVVLLAPAPPEPQASPEAANPVHKRLLVLPDSPRPQELRDALVNICAAMGREGGGRQ